jgi:alanyl-tRNA synthetase
LVSLDGEFELSFFKENGFNRRKCQVCGVHYWTQNTESKNCGDAPCQEYTFIGDSPSKRSYSLPQFRELFLNFFEKNNHTIISPYPVIARWRDDVYLVGASIYNFQPYVTEGRIPPPANPLVISQPCIRFTDIDKVGQTFGRHMTIFEMGGAHAFNSSEKKIYWKDETVRFHHELLTQGLGVDSEKVTYKEDFWSGGGNAGPDVEACVAGLEISTLVFMMYRYVGEQLVEMPIKTVDTGYGIERWTWLSQGSPTGFHATYGTLLDTVADLAGLKIDERIIAASARIASTMTSQTAPSATATKVRSTESLDFSAEELERTISNFQNICTVLDHTKTLCFLLSEGVVPSNMQEGYLARLLVRRAYRILRALGIEELFLNIVERQIAHWSDSFPNLGIMQDEIIEELKVEQEKYNRTLIKGVDLVKRISQDIKKSGLKEIPEKTLIELYDSHGLVPEMVREFVQPESIAISAPEDFFGKVAQRHLQSKQPEEPSEMRILKEKASTFPKTKKLYYEDPYLTKFTARVLDVINGRHLILDQTCFYSEGGGQLADIGLIKFNGETSKIVDVQSVGDVVVHITEGNQPAVGSEIQGLIDWQRRLSLMRHHTSTHILIGASRRVLGEHAWQRGAAKDVETSRLDISHFKHLTTEEVRRIEDLACQVITRNIPVETACISRGEAERKYGYRLYQGGAVPGTVIRIVKIGDWDVEACAGTHVRSTGEIGIIKILRTDRIQDGVERIIFASGPQALKKIQERELELSETAKTLNTPIENLSSAAAIVAKDMDALTKKISRLREELATREAETLLAKSRKIGRTKLIVSQEEEANEEDIIILGSKTTNAEPKAVAIILLVKKTVRLFVFAGKDAIKAGIDAGKLARELTAIIGGGGGGRNYFGQGGGMEKDKLQKMIRLAPKIVSKQLSKR